MEEAIVDALSKGWIASSYTPRVAVFTHPGSTGMDTAGHVVLLMLSLLTCGVFLPIWLALYAYYTMTATPSQTLIIRDAGTEITKELIKR